MMQLLEKHMHNTNSTKLPENSITTLQKKKFESHYESNYPLVDTQKFNHINSLLNNNVYYDLMVREIVN